MDSLPSWSGLRGGLGDGGVGGMLPLMMMTDSFGRTYYTQSHSGGHHGSHGAVHGGSYGGGYSAQPAYYSRGRHSGMGDMMLPMMMMSGGVGTEQMLPLMMMGGMSGHGDRYKNIPMTMSSP